MSSSRLIVFAFIAVLLGACSPKREEPVFERHYQLTGKIVALDSEHQMATIDAAAIPNFMEAMTMEYPIQSKAEFKTLHIGDRVKATVNVTASGDYYTLTDIQKQNARR